MTSVYQCKICDSFVPKERSQAPDWDGETCSDECAQELEDLLEIPWVEEFPNWDTYMEYGDEDLVPEDDRED